jgi:hypothetical protein
MSVSLALAGYRHRLAGLGIDHDAIGAGQLDRAEGADLALFGDDAGGLGLCWRLGEAGVAGDGGAGKGGGDGGELDGGLHDLVLMDMRRCRETERYDKPAPSACEKRQTCKIAGSTAKDGD